MRVRHYFSDFHGLGGVNRMIREHHVHDSERGLNSRFIIYTERGDQPEERAVFLGLQGWRTIARARRLSRREIRANSVDTAIFHGLWGFQNLADLEDAPNLALILHGETPGLFEVLEGCGANLSAIGCVSLALEEGAKAACPFLPEDSIVRIPYPVDEPCLGPSDGRRGCWGSGPIRIGVCGRIAREQKRVDRIPELCDALRRIGLRFRIEILGDGPDRNWLEQRLSGFPEASFLGSRYAGEYWAAVSNWDCIFFGSDYEGLPIAMLEAMRCGVIPVFPRIGCGGDEYAARVHDRLVYEAGKVESATNVFKWLCEHSGETIESFRQACLRLVSRHTLQGYYEGIHVLLSRTAAASVEKERVRSFQGRNWVCDRVPFLFLEKSALWRNRKRLSSLKRGSLGIRDRETGLFFRSE